MVDTKNELLLGTCAKMLGCVGRNQLFKVLRDNHVLMTGNGYDNKTHNEPKQKYMKLGYFTVKLRPFKIYKDGVQIDKTGSQTYITAKGIVWIQENIKTWLKEAL